MLALFHAGPMVFEQDPLLPSSKAGWIRPMVVVQVKRVGVIHMALRLEER